MKTNITLLFFLTFTLLLNSSCATIIGKSKYPFTVSTKPESATVSIKNHKGEVIAKDKTPFTLELKSGKGYFKRAKYEATIVLDGYKEQTVSLNFESKLDGWYFGNLIFGGVIGMLIVDPLTGAMYKPTNQYINVQLIPLNTSIDVPTLQIYNLADIPEEMREHLVRINP